MKDFIGRELTAGTKVVVVYHPEPYKFSIEKATVCEGGTEKRMVLTLENGKTYRQMSRYDENVGDIIFPRVTVYDDKYSDTAENRDMFGQPFDIGSRVAYMLPIELANTCKGYGYGEITKITPKTVTLKVGDKLLRKNRNKIIVSN